jgi:hypothetical protein
MRWPGRKTNGEFNAEIILTAIFSKLDKTDIR